MGTCIICGTSTDGEVCGVHEEDVAFVFEGSSPDQLTANRYYQGTVDGYADFGVFVDVGDSVTGLLHQSELDQRLESLSWEPGDKVFVQVDGVRDNGNVDLSWSIRQAPEEFRGLLIDAPDGDRRPEPEEDDASASGADPASSDASAPEVRTSDSDVRTRQSDGGTTTARDQTAPSDLDDGSGADGSASGDAADVEATDAPAEADPAPADADPVDADAGDLDEYVGDLVRIEGEVAGVHQTSGPTIFELRDGTGTIECAAFDGAGIRAYPDVEVGDVVRLDGVVERRRGDLQIETETLLVLTGEERDAVATRIDEAIEAAVSPDAAAFVAEDDPAAPLSEGILEAATALRRAVAEDRSVVIRHPATADGYAAGAAIERAVLHRLRAENDGVEPGYHAVDRRPQDDSVYGMDAATTDLTRMLRDRERHGEALPLVVLVGIGSSTEASEATDLLDVYDVDRIVLDVSRPDDGIDDVAKTIVNPHLEGVEATLSNAALGSALAATVAPDVVDEFAHVPAVGYWEDVPEAYATTAADAGYEADACRSIREALALEAHYQSYNDKRELVSDLLFDGALDLSEHVAEQFREKLETELGTARENLVVREAGDVHFAVLDTNAFTHRFDFPPTELLVDELHRREREAADGEVVTIGAGEEELHVRSTETVDVQSIADAASESVPGISAVGGRDGHLEYLPGTRDDAIEAVIGALAGGLDD